MKKILSGFVAMIMLLTLMPLQGVFAVNTVTVDEVKLTDGTNKLDMLSPSQKVYISVSSTGVATGKVAVAIYGKNSRLLKVNIVDYIQNQKLSIPYTITSTKEETFVKVFVLKDLNSISPVSKVGLCDFSTYALQDTGFVPMSITEDFQTLAVGDKWGATVGSPLTPGVKDLNADGTTGNTNKFYGLTNTFGISEFGAGTRVATKSFSTPLDGNYVEVNMDVFLGATDVNGTCINSFELRSSTGVNILTLKWNATSKSTREGVYLEKSVTKIGTATTEVNKWATFKALIDFKSKKVLYANIRQVGLAVDPLYIASDVDFEDDSADDIGAFVVSMVRGSTVGTVSGVSRGAFFIDNINMKRVIPTSVATVAGDNNPETPLYGANSYLYSASALFDVSNTPVTGDFLWAVRMSDGSEVKGAEIVKNNNPLITSDIELKFDSSAKIGTYYLMARLKNKLDSFKEIPVTLQSLPKDLTLKPTQIPATALNNYEENFNNLAIGNTWGTVTTNTKWQPTLGGVFDLGGGDLAYGIPNNLTDLQDFTAVDTTISKTLSQKLTDKYIMINTDVRLLGNEKYPANINEFSIRSSTGKKLLRLTYNTHASSGRCGLWLENQTATKIYPNTDLGVWFNIKAFADLGTKQFKYLEISKKGTSETYITENVPFADLLSEDVGIVAVNFGRVSGGSTARGAATINNFSVKRAEPTSFATKGTNEIVLPTTGTVGYSFDAPATYAETSKTLPINVVWSLMDANGNIPQNVRMINKRGSNDVILYVSSNTSVGDYILTAQYPYDFTKKQVFNVKFTKTSAPTATPQLNGDPTKTRQMEFLDRGVTATKIGTYKYYISWRSLGNESLDDVGYDIYRSNVKINTDPIISKTNFIDDFGTDSASYVIKSVRKVNGKWLFYDESKPSKVALNPYIDIPMDRPTKSYRNATYSMHDSSVGDLDGDGEYEIVVKWDPSDAQDPTHSGSTSETYFDAYKLDGTKLWRINLGKNIRAGAHYTNFLVYDFDGDGKAEIAMRTADGTKDGLGNPVGDASNTRNYSATGDYRCQLAPDYLTVFRGTDAAQLASIPYYAPSGAFEEDVTDPATGVVTKQLNVTNVNAQWGDTNRADRFLASVAHLDGKTPSILMARGYYAKSTMAAFNYKDGKITKVWEINSAEPQKNVGGVAYPKFAGQGNHNISAGDVDGDGCDEIMYGGAGVDHNGKLMYSTGFGHADSMHLADHIPSRPGLEVVIGHEDTPCLEMHDAKTGEVLARQNATGDVGRSMGDDVDPTYEGSEIWSTSGTGTGVEGYVMGSVTAGGGLNGAYRRESDGVFREYSQSFWVMPNFATYWDGDLVREASNGLERSGYRIYKYNTVTKKTETLATLADGFTSTNSTKATPLLQADIFGDWREEIILPSIANDKIRIYMTTTPTEYRIPTLMHDPIYRLGVAWQNIGYNQPPHTGYYLGGSTYRKPSIYNWYLPISK